MCVKAGRACAGGPHVARWEGRPGVPAGSFAARGGGSNLIWIEPELDLVVVARWIDGRAVGELLRRVLAAVESPGDEPVEGP